MNPSQILELPHRRNPCLVANAHYPPQLCLVTQSNTEFMESFRTVGQTAFYLTGLMEGSLYRCKVRMDLVAQVASIHPATGAVAFRKAAPYSDGCEGMPETAPRK